VNQSQAGRSTRLVLSIGLCALLATGLAVERLNLFSRLAFALQRTPGAMPSTTAAPEGVIKSGRALLSVYVAPRDLYDRDTGILQHPGERGVEWERPAYVSYFDQGELLFASAAHIRVHGGKSRLNSPVQSYRLYFDREYSAGQFRPGVLFGGSADPIERLVVHNDLRQDQKGVWWHFVNPLAFDIARRIGSVTPSTQPVTLALNGEPQGPYVLSEHVMSRAFQRAHFGHKNFVYEDTQASIKLWGWLRSIEVLTVGQVNEMVDLENLTRWMISVLFCATTDPFQGVILRDTTRPDSRWFWVNWDMDHSFMDFYQRADVPWEHDTFRTNFGKRDIRSAIVTRLIEEDPEYVEYFRRTLIDTLNHRITPAFLNERLLYYTAAARQHEVPDTTYLPILAEFLQRRPAAFRRLAQKHLPAGAIWRAVVHAPSGVELSIDGFPAGHEYEGWYFDGMQLEVALPAQRTDGFSHWLVDGRRVDQQGLSLRLRVDHELSVEAVYDQD
jgi:hypothetical protein